MPVINSEFSCPLCKRSTGQIVRIVASNQTLQCPNGHRWTDTMEFMNANPEIDFKPEVPKNLPQENHEPLTITIPRSLKEVLKEKLGEKMNASITAMLWQMLEGDVMFVSAASVAQLQDWLGKKPANSAELNGLVYAKVCEARDAREERDIAVADLKAYEGVSPGRVVVDLGANFNAIREKAIEAQIPVKMWVERTIKDGVENQWF